MQRRARRLACALATGGVCLLTATAAAIAAPVAPSGFTVQQFAGAPADGATEPDDIAKLYGAVAVAWQNGLGPLGEASKSGATQSDVVLYSSDGAALRDWKVAGHVDGLAADLRRGQIVATVNEDGNTSLYTIDALFPGAQPVHYAFSPEPDSAHTGGVFTGGGTDGVQVLPDGQLLISASAPNNGSGGPVPNATATFLATLDPFTHTAKLAPTFADDANATDALTGQTVTLGPAGASPEALTDSDSNALVPQSSPLYGGQYMLNSQGDQLLVFARGLDQDEQGGHGDQGDQGARPFGGEQSPLEDRQLGLTELPLSRGGTPAGVDDVTWATDARGTLYVVDHSADVIYAVSGPFAAGESFAALDSVGSSSNNTEVDRLDLTHGAMSPFITGLTTAKGLLFVPAGHDWPYLMARGTNSGSSAFVP